MNDITRTYLETLKILAETVEFEEGAKSKEDFINTALESALDAIAEKLTFERVKNAYAIAAMNLLKKNILDKKVIL